MKRMMSLVLALVMLCSLGTVAASAAPKNEIETIFGVYIGQTKLVEEDDGINVSSTKSREATFSYIGEYCKELRFIRVDPATGKTKLIKTFEPKSVSGLSVCNGSVTLPAGEYVLRVQVRDRLSALQIYEYQFVNIPANATSYVGTVTALNKLVSFTARNRYQAAGVEFKLGIVGEPKSVEYRLDDDVRRSVEKNNTFTLGQYHGNVDVIVITKENVEVVRTFSVTIDNVAPVITLTSDGKELKNGEIPAYGKPLEITVTDASYLTSVVITDGSKKTEKTFDVDDATKTYTYKTTVKNQRLDVVAKDAMLNEKAAAVMAQSGALSVAELRYGTTVLETGKMNDISDHTKAYILAINGDADTVTVKAGGKEVRLISEGGNQYSFTYTPSADGNYNIEIFLKNGSVSETVTYPIRYRTQSFRPDVTYLSKALSYSNVNTLARGYELFYLDFGLKGLNVTAVSASVGYRDELKTSDVAVYRSSYGIYTLRAPLVKGEYTLYLKVNVGSVDYLYELDFDIAGSGTESSTTLHTLTYGETTLTGGKSYTFTEDDIFTVSYTGTGYVYYKFGTGAYTRVYGYNNTYAFYPPEENGTYTLTVKVDGKETAYTVTFADKAPVTPESSTQIVLTVNGTNLSESVYNILPNAIQRGTLTVLSDSSVSGVAYRYVYADGTSDEWKNASYSSLKYENLKFKYTYTMNVEPVVNATLEVRVSNYGGKFVYTSYPVTVYTTPVTEKISAKAGNVTLNNAAVNTLEYDNRNVTVYVAYEVKAARLDYTTDGVNWYQATYEGFKTVSNQLYKTYSLTLPVAFTGLLQVRARDNSYNYSYNRYNIATKAQVANTYFARDLKEISSLNLSGNGGTVQFVVENPAQISYVRFSMTMNGQTFTPYAFSTTTQVNGRTALVYTLTMPDGTFGGSVTAYVTDLNYRTTTETLAVTSKSVQMTATLTAANLLPELGIVSPYFTVTAKSDAYDYTNNFYSAKLYINGVYYSDITLNTSYTGQATGTFLVPGGFGVNVQVIVTDRYGNMTTAQGVYNIYSM